MGERKNGIIETERLTIRHIVVDDWEIIKAKWASANSSTEMIPNRNLEEERSYEFFI